MGLRPPVRASSAQYAAICDGFLTDLNDQPLEAVVSLRFSLYAQAENGEALWSERRADVVVRDGAFSELARTLPSGRSGAICPGIADEGDELSLGNA